MKVCVLGLGEVGLPTAKYVASKVMQVSGYDIKQEAVERAKAQGIKASSDWQEIPVSDVYIICVYAGLKNTNPDFSSIFDVCEKINRKKMLVSSSKVCLVSVESTVMPGLCRKVYEEKFKRHVKLVHVPHRYWAGEPVKHGVKQLRVIGGVDADSLKAGLEFYRDVLGIPLHVVSSVEVAEMSKIAENAYRYVQIAFAEELKMVCGELEVDFNEARDACNTKWNIEIPEARDGIGSHCLPKDTRYFVSLTENAKLVKSAMWVDEIYKKRIREKIDK